MTEIPNIGFKKKSNRVLEFEILKLQDLIASADWLPFRIDGPHQVSFFHIVFVTKGKGRHFIDFKPYEFSKGSLIFVSVGQVHAFDIRPGIEGFVILFTEDFISRNVARADGLVLSRLYNPFLDIPVIQPNAIAIRAFDSLVREIESEYSGVDDFAKEDILSLLLKVVLLQAERIKRTLLPDRVKPEQFAQFEEFRRMLDRFVRTSRNAQDYAGQLGVSYKHLNTICKSVTGTTAKACVDQHLVLQLKRELAISEISIKELSYSFSFDEPTNFVKFFKKHVGQSPAQFRDALRDS